MVALIVQLSSGFLDRLFSLLRLKFGLLSVDLFPLLLFNLIPYLLRLQLFLPLAL